jgi:membrane protease YdiL (CAAX protease family)
MVAGAREEPIASLDPESGHKRSRASPTGLTVALGLAVLVVLVVGAFVPAIRPAVLVGLAVGAVVAARGSALLWVFAAGLPVAIILTWGSVVGDQARADLLDCANPLSAVALLRVAEAVTVIGVVLLLARRLGVGLQSLGLRRPTRPETLASLVAIATIPAASLVVGGILAEPFFGPVRLHLVAPIAIIPALMLAVANGTMEELAYRGALMSWLRPAVGMRLALVGQAVVFGAAHAGSDYVASAIPVILVIATGGLLAGLIVRRTGSLLLPIVVHICFDVPLYYAAVCRLP